MRAVTIETFGSYENGRIAELDVPKPNRGEVVIEVHAVPVNYVDLVVAAGKYQFAPPLPYTPGKGPAGRIVALGEGVERLHVGDRVLAMAETGGYAQFARARQEDCFRLPDRMPYSHAAAMSLAYDTAWFALRDRAQIAPGETMLALGASGAVGRACLQLGKAMGARTIATVSSLARVSAVQGAADAIVDLSVDNLRDSFRDQVFAATDGKGADVVIDMLGGDIFDAAIRAVAWRGRVVIVGFAAGRIPTLKVNYLMLKNIAISGLQVSDYRKRRPDMMIECYNEVFGMYDAGKIDPGPIRELPLDDFKMALSALEKRETTDRLVLLPQDGR
jgi:NADPH2:quinone reductase